MKVETTDSAALFKALGDPTRLRIVRMLSCCPDQIEGCEPGPTAGAVCCEITGADRITSTVSHHLKELREAGLITMDRSGKHMICSLKRDAIRSLAQELLAIADNAQPCDGPECC